MSPQTDYSQTVDLGIEGQIADTANRTVDSLSNEEAAAVPFGRGVALGTGDDQFLLPAATGFDFRGVTVHTHATEDPADDGYASKEAASILRKGRIVVKPEQAVAPGDPVFLRHTAGGAGEVPGRFRKDLDVNKADDVSAYCAWKTSAAADGLAVLEVNLP